MISNQILGILSKILLALHAKEKNSCTFLIYYDASTNGTAAFGGLIDEFTNKNLPTMVLADKYLDIAHVTFSNLNRRKIYIQSVSQPLKPFEYINCLITVTNIPRMKTMAILHESATVKYSIILGGEAHNILHAWSQPKYPYIHIDSYGIMHLKCPTIFGGVWILLQSLDDLDDICSIKAPVLKGGLLHVIDSTVELIEIITLSLVVQYLNCKIAVYSPEEDLAGKPSKTWANWDTNSYHFSASFKRFKENVAFLRRDQIVWRRPVRGGRVIIIADDRWLAVGAITFRNKNYKTFHYNNRAHEDMKSYAFLPPIESHNYHLVTRHPRSHPANLRPFDSLPPSVWWAFTVTCGTFFLASISFNYVMMKGKFDSILLIDPSSAKWFGKFHNGIFFPFFWAILIASIIFFYCIDVRANLIGQTFEPEVNHWTDISFLESQYTLVVEDRNILLRFPSEGLLDHQLVLLWDELPNWNGYLRAISLRQHDSLSAAIRISEQVQVSSQSVFSMTRHTYILLAVWYVRHHSNAFPLRISTTPVTTPVSNKMHWNVLKTSIIYEYLCVAILKALETGIPNEFMQAKTSINFDRNPNKWTASEEAAKVLTFQTTSYIFTTLISILMVLVVSFLAEISRKQFGAKLKGFRKIRSKYTVMISIVVGGIFIGSIFILAVGKVVVEVLSTDDKFAFAIVKPATRASKSVIIFDESGVECQRFSYPSTTSNNLYGSYSYEADVMFLAYEFHPTFTMVPHVKGDAFVGQILPLSVGLRENGTVILLNNGTKLWYLGGKLYDDVKKLSLFTTRTLYVQLNSLLSSEGPTLPVETLHPCALELSDTRMFVAGKNGTEFFAFIYENVTQNGQHISHERLYSDNISSLMFSHRITCAKLDSDKIVIQADVNYTLVLDLGTKELTPLTNNIYGTETEAIVFSNQDSSVGYLLGKTYKKTTVYKLKDVNKGWIFMHDIPISVTHRTFLFPVLHKYCDDEDPLTIYGLPLVGDNYEKKPKGN